MALSLIMKRSSSIKLVLIGSSLVFLSACDQKPDESKANTKALAAVKAPHSETFTSKEECEKVYGEGKCGSKPHESERGSVFMPLVAGYMLGSMLNQPRSGATNSVGTNVQEQQARRGGFGGQAPRYSSSAGG